MLDTRLIMLEGLHGTGKSTNSHFLQLQLERNGYQAEFIYESIRPHPLLFFYEACLTHAEYKALLEAYPDVASIFDAVVIKRANTVSIDIIEIEWNYKELIGEDAFKAICKYNAWGFPLDKYIDVSLDKWTYFCERALMDEGTVYLLDSAFFQFQIVSFLAKNAPYGQLEDYVNKLIGIIRPLNPALIHLYRENAEETIRFLEEARGIKELEILSEINKAEPYFQDKPAGAEGYRQFMRDWASIADKLFNVLDCKKLAVEISGNNWKRYESDMLSFLGIEEKPAPSFLPYNGVYKNDGLGLEIVVDGLSIKDPYGQVGTLIPKSRREYCVSGMPVILVYETQSRIIMSGTQTCHRWTTTGTAYDLK